MKKNTQKYDKYVTIKYIVQKKLSFEGMDFSKKDGKEKDFGKDTDSKEKMGGLCSDRSDHAVLAGNGRTGFCI